MQAAASKIQTSSSSPIFRKLRSSSNPTNKNLKELGLYIQRAVSVYPFRISRMHI